MGERALAEPPYVHASPVPERHGQARHGHLWHLADGTGLHAPLATLVVDPESRRLCCHLCGLWFRSLGSHVRAHGYTADAYREDIGLCRGQALTDGSLSAAISARQRERFSLHEEMRVQLSRGRERRSAAPGVEAGTRQERPTTAAAAARQADARAAGRATRRAEQQARLDAVVADAGYDDLSAMLRARHAAGASLESLARDTGLGRATLRHALEAAGVSMRGQGQTTSAGRQARARRADLVAAGRVGTDDLPFWLRSRRDAGWTLARLGEAVGHSGHWVRWRLEAS